MSEQYLQAFPYCFLEPCCIFSADPTWFGVDKPQSARNMFTLQLLGGVETSLVYNKKANSTSCRSFEDKMGHSTRLCH